MGISFSVIFNKEIHASERASITTLALKRRQLQGASPPYPHQGTLVPEPLHGVLSSGPGVNFAPSNDLPWRRPWFTHVYTQNIWVALLGPYRMWSTIPFVLIPKLARFKKKKTIFNLTKQKTPLFLEHQRFQTPIRNACYMFYCQKSSLFMWLSNSVWRTTELLNAID